MSPDLEYTHRQGGFQYSDRWRAQPAEVYCRSHDKGTASSDKTKLDDGQSDWVTKLFEDGFPGV